MAKIHKIMAIIFFHINTFKTQVAHFEETKEPHSAFSRYVCGTCLSDQIVWLIVDYLGEHFCLVVHVKATYCSHKPNGLKLNI